MNPRRAFRACFILAFAAWGCDGKPVAPTSTTDAQPPSSAVPNVRTAPRVTIDLEHLPLSARVPDSWRLDRSNSLLMQLTGPSPGGTVQISFSRSNNLIRPNMVDGLIAEDIRHALADDRHQVRSQSMTINDMKVWESISQPQSPATAPAPATEPIFLIHSQEANLVQIGRASCRERV